MADRNVGPADIGGGPGCAPGRDSARYLHSIFLRAAIQPLGRILGKRSPHHDIENPGVIGQSRIVPRPAMAGGCPIGPGRRQGNQHGRLAQHGLGALAGQEDPGMKIQGASPGQHIPGIAAAQADADLATREVGQGPGGLPAPVPFPVRS